VPRVGGPGRDQQPARRAQPLAEREQRRLPRAVPGDAVNVVEADELRRINVVENRGGEFRRLGERDVGDAVSNMLAPIAIRSAPVSAR